MEEGDDCQDSIPNKQQKMSKLNQFITGNQKKKKLKKEKNQQ